MARSCLIRDAAAFAGCVAEQKVTARFASSAIANNQIFLSCLKRKSACFSARLGPDHQGFGRVAMELLEDLELDCDAAPDGPHIGLVGRQERFFVAFDGCNSGQNDDGCRWNLTAGPAPHRSP